MSVEKNIRDFLLSQPAITNYISDRIYIERAPQRAQMPYVIMGTFNKEHIYYLQNEAGITVNMIQLDVVARDPSGWWTANAIGENIRLALSGKTGEVGDGVIQEATIARDDIVDLPPLAAGDEHAIKRSMDFRVWYGQTEPTH